MLPSDFFTASGGGAKIKTLLGYVFSALECGSHDSNSDLLSLNELLTTPVAFCLPRAGLAGFAESRGPHSTARWGGRQGRMVGLWALGEGTNQTAACRPSVGTV